MHTVEAVGLVVDKSSRYDGHNLFVNTDVIQSTLIETLEPHISIESCKTMSTTSTMNGEPVISCNLGTMAMICTGAISIAL